MTPDAPTVAVSHGALFYVAAVNIIIWAGLLAYLVHLDRKVRAAIARQSPEDPPGRKPTGPAPLSSSPSSSSA